MTIHEGSRRYLYHFAQDEGINIHPEPDYHQRRKVSQVVLGGVNGRCVDECIQELHVLRITDK